MSGPKRSMFPGGHYQIGSAKVPILNKKNVGIDFDQHPAALEEIGKIYQLYEGRRREQRNSAGRDELGQILKSLQLSCFQARRRLAEPWKGLSGPRALQVQGQ